MVASLRATNDSKLTNAGLTRGWLSDKDVAGLDKGIYKIAEFASQSGMSAKEFNTFVRQVEAGTAKIDSVTKAQLQSELVSLNQITRARIESVTALQKQPVTMDFMRHRTDLLMEKSGLGLGNIDPANMARLEQTFARISKTANELGYSEDKLRRFYTTYSSFKPSNALEAQLKADIAASEAFTNKIIADIRKVDAARARVANLPHLQSVMQSMQMAPTGNTTLDAQMNQLANRTVRLADEAGMTKEQFQQMFVSLTNGATVVEAKFQKVYDSLLRLQAIQENVTRKGLGTPTLAGALTGQNKMETLQGMVAAMSPIQEPWRMSQEQINYVNKTRVALVDLLHQSNLTSSEIETMWRQAAQGGTFYADALRTKVQSAMVNVQRAAQGITDQFSLINKWASRFVGILVHVAGYQVFYGLVNQLTDAVSKFNELETKVAQIKTISQDLPQSFDSWANSLSKLSTAWGKDLFDQSKAAYDALSNQIANAQNVTKFLESSNKLAATGLSTTTQAGNLLATAMNSYGMSMASTEKLSAQFFKTVDVGRILISDMADRMGDVLVPASQLGISIAEVNAAFATTTIAGVEPTRAATYLRNVMVSLTNPTKEMKELFEEFGVSSGEDLVRALGGLGGVLEAIAKKTGRNSTSVDELVRRQSGLAAIMSLSRNNLLDYNRAYEEITGSMEEYQVAASLVQETDAFKLQQNMQELKNFWTIDVGGKAMEFVKLAGSLSGLVDIIKTLTASATTWGAAVATLYSIRKLGNLATALNTPRIGGMNIRAKEGMISGATWAATTGAFALYQAMEDLKKGQENWLSASVKFATGVDLTIRDPMERAKAYTDDLVVSFEALRDAAGETVDEGLKKLMDSERTLASVYATQTQYLNRLIKEYDTYIDQRQDLYNINRQGIAKVQDSTISEIEKQATKAASAVERVKNRLQSLGEDREKLQIKYEFGTLDDASKFRRLKSELVKKISSASAGEGENALILKDKAIQRYLNEGMNIRSKLYERTKALQSRLNEIDIRYAEAQAKGAKGKKLASIEAERNAVVRKIAQLPRLETEKWFDDLGSAWITKYTKILETFQKQALAKQRALEDQKALQESARDQSRAALSTVGDARKELIKMVAGGASSQEIQEYGKLVSDSITKAMDLGSKTGIFDGSAYGKQLLKTLEEEKMTLETSFKLAEGKSKQVEFVKEATKAWSDFRDSLMLARTELEKTITEMEAGVTSIEGITGTINRIQNKDGQLYGNNPELAEMLRAINGDAVSKNVMKGQFETLLGTMKGADVERMLRYSKQTDYGKSADRDSLKQLVKQYQAANPDDEKGTRLEEIIDGMRTTKDRKNRYYDALNLFLASSKGDAGTADLRAELAKQSNDARGSKAWKYSSAEQQKAAEEAEKAKLRKMEEAIKSTIEKYPAMAKQLKAVSDPIDNIKTSMETLDKVLAKKLKIDPTAFAVKDSTVESLAAVSYHLQAIMSSINAINTRPLNLPTQANGGPVRKASGGQMFGSDSIHTVLSPGEFVVNAASTRRFYSQLVGMNAQRLANGGNVQNVTTGDFNISVQASGNANVDVQRIGRALRREIRRGTIRLGV